MTTAAQRARQDARHRDGRYAEMRRTDPGDINLAGGPATEDVERFGNPWGLDPANDNDAAQIDFRLAQFANPDLTWEKFSSRYGAARSFGEVPDWDMPPVGTGCTLNAPIGRSPKQAVHAKVMQHRREHAAAWLAGEQDRAARAAEFDSKRMRNTTPPGWESTAKTYEHPTTGHKLQQTWRESPAGWKGYSADGTYIGFAKTRTDALAMLRNHHAGINPVDQWVLAQERVTVGWSVD